MIRTFIALELPKASLNEIISLKESVTQNNSNARWEPIEKLHLTIKFLGDTNESIINEISDSLDKYFSNTNKLALNFEKFGFFWQDNQPRILWLGLKEDEKLVCLVKEVNEILNKFGFEKEKRSFKPHITLLRFKGHENLDSIIKLKDVRLENHQFISDTVHFFKSDLYKNGSVYTSLKKFQLN